MSQKKLVIQAFRPNGMQMDLNAARVTLTELSQAFDQIYNRNSSQLSFEELYRKAYNMVLQKHGDLLYDGVKQMFVKHLQTSSTLIAQTPSELFLSVLVREWQSHDVAFNMVKGVLLYMEKFYCIQKGKLLIYDLAVQLFRNEIVYDPSIRNKIHQHLLREIESERKGFMIDRHLMKDTLHMLVTLGKSDNSQVVQVRENIALPSTNGTSISTTSVYTEEFEDPFIAATAEFYRMESLEYLSQNTCPEYLRKVEQRLNEEIARVGHYLSHSTETKLLECLEKEMIITHARTLIDMEGSGLSVLLSEHKLDDLRRMYTLFNRVGICADILRDGVAKFIFNTGQAIVNGQDANKDPVSFVKAILDLKDKFDDINTASFRNDKKTAKKMREAFESFVNKDTRTASHLASYVDELLKGGVGGQTDAEVELKFEKFIVIFRFLSDKDIFENYYKTLLSKRLLSSKSVSDDHERAMIAKLKAECGYQYTSKLEGMFQDVGISDSVMKDFLKSPQASGSSIEMEVQVLTTGFWPLPAPPKCNLAGQLRELCTRFENFYMEKNSGRKLSWMPQLGSVDLRVSISADSMNNLY
jgi:cullin 3